MILKKIIVSYLIHETVFTKKIFYFFDRVQTKSNIKKGTKLAIKILLNTC